MAHRRRLWALECTFKVKHGGISEDSQAGRLRFLSPSPQGSGAWSPTFSSRDRFHWAKPQHTVVSRILEAPSAELCCGGGKGRSILQLEEARLACGRALSTPAEKGLSSRGEGEGPRSVPTELRAVGARGESWASHGVETGILPSQFVFGGGGGGEAV